MTAQKAVKFVGAWKKANGDPDEEGIDKATKDARKIPPTVREIGAAFDNLMPLLLAGAGVAIGPAGYVIAQAIPAEDGSGAPLHLARGGPPANLTVPILIASMTTACTTLSLAALAGVPPTPETALAAWVLTPAGIFEAKATLEPPFPEPKLTLAMAQYLGTVSDGGVGVEDDAPPPPGLLPTDIAPTLPAEGVMFRYETSGTDPSLGAHEVRFTSYLLPRHWTPSINSRQLPDEVLVYAWRFDDLNGPTNLGISTEGPVTTFRFPFRDFFDVTLTVCNAAGSIAGTRSLYSD